MLKETLQEEYDLLLKEIRLLETRKKDLVEKIEKNGFFIKKNLLQENKQVYGYIYDLTFYSHFDGHTSDAIYDDEKGSAVITESLFNRLKAACLNYKATGEEDNELIDEFDIPWFSEPEDITNFWNHFIIDEKINTILWKYAGEQDQSELCDESYVEFSLSSLQYFK